MTDAPLVRLDVLPAPEDADLLQTVLAEFAPQGWEELEPEKCGCDQEDCPGRVAYRVHFEGRELAQAMSDQIARRFPDAAIRLEDIVREEWALAWKDYFTPVQAGGVFEILPPWLADEAHEGMKPIIIEPKMAFGTGHHPTTALCLEVAGDLYRSGRLSRVARFLDLGTGSGILGIAMAKVGMTGHGLDIDHQAVTCAIENIAVNDVSQSFSVSEGSIDAAEGAYDLVLANILARPLMAMAERITEAVAPGGFLLLSGILAEQADDVANAFLRAGLPAPEVRGRDEWAVLVFEKPSA
jgi:ribosomal protein L11 methyltransferase